MLPVNRAEIAMRRGEIARSLAKSRANLDAAVLAAWTVGCMLRDERRRVRTAMGRSAWPEWLRVVFSGKPAVAVRYVRLAEEINCPAKLHALSLRQAYFRLGVSTEPKFRSSTRQRKCLAGYIRNAQRLVIELRRQRRSRTATEIQRVRFDLGPLYRELTFLFDTNSAEEPTSAADSVRTNQIGG